MRQVVTGFWTVLLAFCTPGDSVGQMPPIWTEPFEPVAIADDMFYVGSAGLSAFLLTSAEGHVLIDAPMAENVPLVLDNIRALGFDPRDIRLHVVTHAHFDHVAGLAELVAATGGEVLVSDGDAPFLRSGLDFGFESDGYPPIPAARTVTHLEPVRVGDVELTPHVTPGHTPGCTSWSGTVSIGEAQHSFVLVCSLSVLDFYRLGPDDPTYVGQAGDFCRSVDHLEALDPDIFLSNHGQFFGLTEKALAVRGGNARAFLGPDELDAFLQDATASIDRQLRRQGLEGCAP